MMVGTWLLISHSIATRFTFWATIGTGTGLFLGLAAYRLSPLIQVVQPLCIVIALLIACWGLLQKQKSEQYVMMSRMHNKVKKKKTTLPIARQSRQERSAAGVSYSSDAARRGGPARSTRFVTSRIV